MFSFEYADSQCDGAWGLLEEQWATGDSARRLEASRAGVRIFCAAPVEALAQVLGFVGVTGGPGANNTEERAAQVRDRLRGWRLRKGALGWASRITTTE